MNAFVELTENERQKILNLIELLLPHFGRDITGLLESVTTVQEYLLGNRHLPLSSTADKA